MNSSKIDQKLLKELERVDDTLSKILSQLINFNDSLRPIEFTLRVNDFSSKGILRRGAINGIVCILSALIKGDPFSISIKELEGKRLELPSIIKSNDRNESKHTCDSILKTVESLYERNVPKFVINLRWAILPRNLNHNRIIIVGTRYSNLDDTDLTEIISKMKQMGYEVLMDRGEYGGGLLTYSLLDTFGNKNTIRVFELTLPKELAENEKHVTQILQVLSAI